MFKLKNKNRLIERTKGIFQTPIQYEVRNPLGDWSLYFGKYQNQRWGQWDSNSCWCLSAVNCLEDQLEWLWKNNMFSAEARKFFADNRYIDSDGDFSISERYLEIKGGYLDNGGYAPDAWKFMQRHGCIPRDMLTYTKQRADSMTTREAFVKDYFSKSVISAEMEKLGQEFLKHVSISVQRIGKLYYTPSILLLKEALKQAPLQIGIPVPKNVSLWNASYVAYDKLGKYPEHEVELYSIDDKNQYEIFDQYMPNLKTLDAKYYVPQVTQGIVTAIKPQAINPVKQDSVLNKFWTSVINWYNGIIDTTVPIG